MMNDLPASVPAATPSRVTFWFARLILMLALVAGTLHAPAAAHVDASSHHAQSEVVDHHAIDIDDHNGSTSSGDTFHHHHCPAALGVAGVDLVSETVSGAALRPIGLIAAMTSRSQAPPTEPPSA
jgi:hypothetical protein